MSSSNKFSFIGPLYKVKGINRCVVLDKFDEDSGMVFQHVPGSGDFPVIGGLIRKDQKALISGQTMVGVMR